MTEVISYNAATIAAATSTLDYSINMNGYNPNPTLLNSLMTFYSEPEHIKQLYMLISGEDKISLRLLEWTIINYAKNELLVINNGITERFSVHANYKATLSGYSKDQFDPCCRTERIDIPYLNKLLKTTIAQLNFIRWVIINKILNYIRENYSVIFKDMKTRSKTAKKTPATITSGDAMTDVATEAKKNETKTRKRRTDAINRHTVKNFKIEQCSTTLKFGINK